MGPVSTKALEVDVLVNNAGIMDDGRRWLDGLLTHLIPG